MSVNTTVASIRPGESWRAASIARPLPPHSIVTHDSSPTTHLSCPGGMSKTSPGPTSRAWPSSMTTCIVPDIA